MCKFGGTSVADTEHLRAVARRLIALRRQGHKVVAVLSAMGSSTDRLVELAHGISTRPQLREFDALLSVGESVSCALAALTINAMGEPAVSLTGAQAGVTTDAAHGCARLYEVRPQRILDAVADGKIVVVTGFQGVSPEGNVTTLGRGGSDASAVALAAALGVRRCEIFTDVAGVFSADPRCVPEAQLLHALTYEEMVALAASGAAVMQTRAVELAANHDIEIHVRSAFTTDDGTLIGKEGHVLEKGTIIGVAHRSQERVYHVCDVSAASLSGALAAEGAAIETLVQRDGEMWFTAPGTEDAAVSAVIGALGGTLIASDPLGSVSLVGTGISSRPELTARALAVLERVGVAAHLVTRTPNRISCHVYTAAVQDAARALHRAFGLNEARAASARVDIAGRAEMTAQACDDHADAIVPGGRGPTQSVLDVASRG